MIIYKSIIALARNQCQPDLKLDTINLQFAGSVCPDCKYYDSVVDPHLAILINLYASLAKSHADLLDGCVIRYRKPGRAVANLGFCTAFAPRSQRFNIPLKYAVGVAQPRPAAAKPGAVAIDANAINWQSGALGRLALDVARAVGV